MHQDCDFPSTKPDALITPEMRAAPVVRIPSWEQRPICPAPPKEECGQVLIWVGIVRVRQED